MPLGLELAREALEPPDRKAREPAYLRELAADGSRFGLDALTDSAPHLLGKGSLQLASKHGEVLDPDARAVERRRNLGVPIRALFDGVEPRLGPLDRRLLHGPNASVAVG